MANNSGWNDSGMNSQKWSDSGVSSQKWTDQDMIGDLLVAEKQMMGAYTQNLTEGSNNAIRQVFKTNFDQTQQDQFQIFQQMQQRGWYHTQPVDSQAYQQTWDQCTRHKNQMA